MRLPAILIFLGLSGAICAQMPPPHLEALNSFTDYANQSADEVAAAVTSVMEYYPTLARKNGIPRFTCPVQLDHHYFNKATEQNKALGATGFPSATRAFQELHAAAEKIDGKCKALDTYHKLEDYKQDNYIKAEALLAGLQMLIKTYRAKQDALRTELEKIYKKVTAATPDNAYRQADKQMQAVIAAERGLIDAWVFNLKEQIHTGWPVEKLQQSIPETNTQLGALSKNTPALHYPASSMWTQFQSSLSAILDIKRKGLDEYNFEAKKSDKHSNNLYLELINYFNGTLVSDYNTFLKFSERDGYLD